MNIKELFTPKETVALTGMKLTQLRKLLYLELIPSIKLGGRVYFDLSGLLEIKTIHKLGLTPSQIRDCQEYFDQIRLSKTLRDKTLIVLDKSIIFVQSLDDLTLLNTTGKGQKILGQVLLPDLFTELREQARILKIENYTKKFPLSLAS